MKKNRPYWLKKELAYIIRNIKKKPYSYLLSMDFPINVYIKKTQYDINYRIDLFEKNKKYLQFNIEFQVIFSSKEEANKLGLKTPFFRKNNIQNISYNFVIRNKENN